MPKTKPCVTVLEHKTCDILAAERLRLMRFVNRLIIDSFQKVLHILKWLFSIKKKNQKEKYGIHFFENPLLEMLGSVYSGNSCHNTWSPPSIQNLKNFHVKACYDINTRYFAKSWVLCDNLSIPYNCDFVDKLSKTN